MSRAGSAIARPQVKELLDIPAAPPVRSARPEPPLAMRWARASIDELVQAVREHVAAASAGRGNAQPKATKPIEGARMVLNCLSVLPGDTWQDRWLLLDAQTAGTGGPRSGIDWRQYLAPEASSKVRDRLTAGLGVLLVMDVFRPSYAWQQFRQLNVLTIVGEHRDAEAMKIFTTTTAQLGNDTLVKHVRQPLGKIQLHTGKSIRQVTAQDLLDMDAALAQLNVPSTSRRSVEHLWRVLTDLGWITHESIAWPLHRVRKPQQSPQELVDQYQIRSPQREVLIEYFKQRRAALDYTTYRNNGYKLLKLFWADVAAHHPDLSDFHLTREMAHAWKQRLQLRSPGQDRVNSISQLLVVRSFYLDMAQWAIEDSFWAPWAAPSPVTRSEVRGYSKLRRTQVARTQERTRQLAPILSRLVAQATSDRRESKQNLQRAIEAGSGGTATIDGRPTTVYQARTNGPWRITDAGVTRNLTYEEDNAFWTWAGIETLRLTGIRCEELHELTHMSIVPYRLPATGEEIPLLHIAPSKSDEERLLVAGPELVHVLAEVIHRVRDGRQEIPLTQRWDQGDHCLSDPQPHLFVRQYGPELRPFSSATLTKMLHTISRRADIRINNEPATFTSHDFRRVFATDALASGLPPHIVQVLLGHKSITTTQVYAAVYPQDVIRHHRHWIAQRRQQRPSEEYRQPTPAEWDEFESHFVKRRVGLGTCGRAYGTNCHHEHACLRCALLRPDPQQIDQLQEIIANLHDRITEAEQNTWLGEVEGLKISLAGAHDKLAQMERPTTTGNTNLGMPTTRPPQKGA